MLFLRTPRILHLRLASCFVFNRHVPKIAIRCLGHYSTSSTETAEIFRKILIKSNDENLDQSFGLLMAILKKPSLGEHVREIVYHKTPRADEEYKMGEFQRHLSDEEMQLVQTAVRNAGFIDRKADRVVNMLMQKSVSSDGGGTWCTGYGYVSNDHIRGTFMAQAIATILISVAPNLVSLAMTRPFDNSFGLWRFPEEWNEVDHVHFPLDKFLRRTNADPEGKSYLQNLRDVYIINEVPDHANVHDNYYRTDFMGCLPLFDRLPAIESVGIDLLDVDDDGRQDIEHRTSNISRIRLNHSSLHPVYLARLIYSCKVIREFQYTIGGRAMGGHGNPFFTPIPVFKVLCEHKHTLETLDLDVESHLPMLRDWDENKVQEHFAEKNPAWHADEEEEALEFQFLTSIWKLEGSLKDFTALRSLTIGIGLLLYFAKGVFLNPDTRQKPIMLLDCLPENLESLCIRGYQRGLNDNWDAQVDALLAHYKSGKSSLKSLTGIEELIPNAVDLEEPIRPRNLRWTLEKIGYEPDEGW